MRHCKVTLDNININGKTYSHVSYSGDQSTHWTFNNHKSKNECSGCAEASQELVLLTQKHYSPAHFIMCQAQMLSFNPCMLDRLLWSFVLHWGFISRISQKKVWGSIRSPNSFSSVTEALRFLSEAEQRKIKDQNIFWKKIYIKRTKITPSQMNQTQPNPIRGM